MRKYLLALAFMLPATSVNAVTNTTNFNAHLLLGNICTVVASTMEFGSISGLIKGTEKATTTISITCTKGTAYTWTMDATVGYMSGTTNPAEQVLYSSPTQTGSGTSSGSTHNWLGNGQLSVQATPSSQDYVEVRLVTVTF